MSMIDRIFKDAVCQFLSINMRQHHYNSLVPNMPLQNALQ
jgi:hypothetical protein